MRANAKTALEAVAYGDTKNAKEHIEIALREAAAASNMGSTDLDELCTACGAPARSILAKSCVKSFRCR